MSDTSPLKAAVVGCGAIAYEHLPFLADSPRAELVAVCDRSRALADAARVRFGAEQSFVDVRTMLEAAKPEVVHVLTPPQTHDALVRLALDSGAHVVCEKPMTGSERETVALLDAADAANRALQESRNLLFNDLIIALKNFIAAGRLGQVRECEILLSLDFLKGPFGDTNLKGPAVSLPVGAVHDFIPHLAYLFLSLSGVGSVDKVRGFLENRSGNRRAGFDSMDALLDAGQVRGRLRVATDTAPDAFRVIVRGSKATAVTDLYNPFMHIEGFPNTGKRAPLGQISAGLSLARAGLTGLRKKIMQHGTMHGLPRMLDAIYAALIERHAPPFSRQDMIDTARLTDQLVALGVNA